MLTSERGADGWESLESAAAQGKPFMVDLRDGVIALDVDRSEGDAWSEAAVAALRGTGCSIVRVGSGRPGHEHVFAVGTVGWASADLVRVAVNAGAPPSKVRRDGMDVRPPLSPYYDGGCGSLIEPADVDSAIWLLSARPGARALDDRWLSMLATGRDPKGEFATARGNLDRNRATMALAVAHVNSGSDFEQFAGHIRSSPTFGEKLAEKGEAWLQKTWSRAMARVRENPPASDNGRTLAEIALTAQRRPWRGVSGETDRLVYTALADTARSVGGVVISRSQRSLAERIGVTRKTINTSLRRLRAAGLVADESPGGYAKAAAYRLRPDPEIVSSYPNSLLSPPDSSEVFTGVSHVSFGAVPDAFRGRGSIPLSALDTLRSMPDEWVTTAEISALRPGTMTPATIRRHLRILLSAGFVDRNGPAGHRWQPTRAHPGLLAAVARHVGAIGSTELQKERHEMERDAYENWFELNGTTRQLADSNRPARPRESSAA